MSSLPLDRFSPSVSLSVSPVPDLEKWTTVPSKQAVKAAKKEISASSPAVKGNLPSRGNPLRTKGPNHAQPRANATISTKPKSWHDPDEQDSLRATRAERTLRVVLPPGTKNVNRSVFLDQVNGTAGLQTLEACGPSAAPNIWHLTFASKEAKELFGAAGDFTTKDGLLAKVEGHRAPLKHWLKVHWVPYHVPMISALRHLDSIQGVKILAASYDKVTLHAGMEHVRSTLRTVLVEAPDATKIPYSIRWSHEGESGLALVTMKGRAPVCLKCNQQGHVRKECTEIKCTVCLQWGHNNPSCNIKRHFSAVLSGAPMAPDADLIEEDLGEEEIGEQTPTLNVCPAPSPPAPQTPEVAVVPPQATLSRATPEPVENPPTPPQKIEPEPQSFRPGVGHEDTSVFDDLMVSSDSDQPDEEPTPSPSSYFLKSAATSAPKTVAIKRKKNKSISGSSSPNLKKVGKKTPK